MLSQIFALINALNSNAKPSHIANGICLGIIMGLVPKGNLLWAVLFVFFMFVRVNKGTYLLFTLVGSLVAPFFDARFDQIGYYILTQPKLEKYFAFILDVPFVAFTKFNNTIVMGSLIGGLLAYLPIFVLGYFFVKFWRNVVATRIAHSPLIAVLQKIPLVGTILKKSSELMKK